MQKFYEESLRTELSLLAQKNRKTKMNRNWQNRPQHTVIALLLHTSVSAINQSQT